MAKLKTWWTPRRHQPMMPPSHSPEKLEERKGPLQLKWSNNQDYSVKYLTITFAMVHW
jgi:hypothetical protein